MLARYGNRHTLLPQTVRAEETLLTHTNSSVIAQCPEEIAGAVRELEEGAVGSAQEGFSQYRVSWANSVPGAKSEDRSSAEKTEDINRGAGV